MIWPMKNATGAARETTGKASGTKAETPATNGGADEIRHPGRLVAMDGSEAVAAVETEASEAAGAYPITPATQMGEHWAAAVAKGKTNAFGRRLVFFEPEGEHAAAGVTAGLSMSGLRSANFSASQGIAYMHESLYAAAGKRLTYVLNMACRAMTKQALNIHAGHDDYHAIDDTGFFQLFAKNVQEAADLNLIAHRIAELALNPGVLAQDGFLTSHVIESLRLPEPELVREFLGDPADRIPSPTPAQRLVFGEERRRIPILFDFDYPTMLGTVQNQDSYAQGVAAQRPFYFDHVAELADRAMDEFARLTGRRYARASGYRLDDAEWVLVGQGTVVGNAEAVADHLRSERGLKVGVLDMTMFRPFPSDLVAKLLAGKKGVTVLERLDQPLAADGPILREVRTALAHAAENGRAVAASGGARLPHAGLPAIDAGQVPDFYGAGFGFGSRDVQPGDLVAAVENMLPGARGVRQYYLGVDFLRRGTRHPKLQLWQEKLLEGYPNLGDLSLTSAGDLDLMPKGSVSVRIHSVGGWGAITMGKNLALTAFELAGLNVKANPKYGSEKKGQPTTFYATLSPEPVRLNAELRHVDVVLSPDPNVFANSDPLAGLREGGAFVLQSDRDPEAVWEELPAEARRRILQRRIRVYVLDGFSIASTEASDPSLRYRMQGAAFMGAFFAVSSVAERQELDEDTLFEGIRERLQAKFGKLGAQVVDDNYRVIQRGYRELRPVEADFAAEGASDVGVGRELPLAPMPGVMAAPDAEEGFGNPGRFYEQVCALYAEGEDGIADPFAALSAMPAASSALRDMTAIRFEVPEFVPANCTGCNKCWTQCPDAAIPGLVNTPQQILDAAIRVATREDRPLDRIRQVSRHLAAEVRSTLEAVPLESFGDTLRASYDNLVGKLGWDPERRAELDRDFAAVYEVAADFPVAVTAPFWELPESREAGSGGLLSITINPYACKGCNICVDVCPDEALVTVRQDDETVERLRHNWRLWEELPDTDDRYINVFDVDEGIGVLPSLLLKKDVYRSMVGGDGACMGCGEKTAVHLVVSAITAAMQRRVEKFVGELDALIEGLDAKARDLLSADADVELAALTEGDTVDLELEPGAKETLRRMASSLESLRDLKWRYEEGPGGRGRAALGISNSTGCSSVWGSTYPFNPYPVPWVNHLFQDAPSIGIGLFEGAMRRMADDFVAVRRARLQLDDKYDPTRHEPAFQTITWEDFTDEEFDLCPPMLVVGGDGAMLDIGFQNLSRLMASGKPIRVLVLDTQVYSNTGGQACTSGFLGQVSDMAEFGKAQHGKREERKELGLIALAHRGTYVLQSSQASPAHLLGGVLRGIRKRRPAIFNIHAPCPVEHGLPDQWGPTAAKMAHESRAFPHFIFDPDAGASIADCLDLDDNPARDATWPSYELTYRDPETDEEHTLELPMTIADWAATEGRFRKHFRELPAEGTEGAPAEETLVPFHEFVELGAEERAGKTAWIHALDDQGRLTRLSVSEEIAELAEDRLAFWSQLRELAGLEVPESVRRSLRSELEAEFESRKRELEAEYETKLEDVRTRYPRMLARRLAEGLVRSGDGSRTLAEILSEAESTPNLEPIRLEEAGVGSNGAAGGAGGAVAPEASASAAGAATMAPPSGSAAPAGASAGPAAEDASPAPSGAPKAEPAGGGLRMEAYIETARCTSCDECTNLNPHMFAYDENKQAYVKDASAGTYRELVQAAERCTAGIIHPGDPLNPDEPDLDKWVERAARFQ
jgi:pyruvate-ferredoxin/flavodoxin oxidoreductase